MFKYFLKLTADTSVSETVAETADKAVEMGFQADNISEALLCSVAGMIGIFIVVGIIILTVSLLNKAGADKKKD